MADQQGINSLAYLHTMNEAGEKGYAVAAMNVKNLGLKILFKAFAQQRARFKDEIRVELQRLGVDITPRTSFRGMVHRGRMNIFATLIIEADGRERMVLREITFGEKVAKSTYEKALRKELPAETCKLLDRQYKEVCDTLEQIYLMLGRDGKRQMIFLYDSARDVEKIVKTLHQAGFPAEAIEKISLADFAEIYQGKGSTISDAVLSGAVGGALWGSLIGSLAGIGAMQTTGVDPLLMASPQNIWTFVALSGVFGGALVGTVLGFFIGMGVSEEDTYQYSHSIERGYAIVRILIDESRAKEAGQILTRAHLDSGILA